MRLLHESVEGQSEKLVSQHSSVNRFEASTNGFPWCPQCETCSSSTSRRFEVQGGAGSTRLNPIADYLLFESVQLRPDLPQLIPHVRAASGQAGQQAQASLISPSRYLLLPDPARRPLHWAEEPSDPVPLAWFQSQSCYPALLRYGRAGSCPA